MHTPAQVLVIGPPPTMLGGMSTVVRQMAHLDFADRYCIQTFPITLSTKTGETRVGRIIRHLRHRLRLGCMLRNVPDICHIHTCSGFSFHRSGWDLRVARRHGCRTVLHMHGAQFDQYYAGTGNRERKFIRRTLESADRVVALSESWKEKLNNMAPKAAITVIENAVEKPAELNHRTTSPRCSFLMLCRMDHWKGVDDLLDACAILKRRGVPFALTLAGPEGSAGDQHDIEAKIQGRGLCESVTYVGPVKGDSRAKCLAESDVLIQPSHNEGLPMSILEAFAQGLAVIATRVGAIPEMMVHAEHGLLVPPRDPPALAGAMSLLAMDPPTRRSLGRCALQLAATRFSMARFRGDLLDLYDGLLRPYRLPNQRRSSATISATREASVPAPSATAL